VGAASRTAVRSCHARSSSSPVTERQVTRASSPPSDGDRRASLGQPAVAERPRRRVPERRERRHHGVGRGGEEGFAQRGRGRARIPARRRGELGRHARGEPRAERVDLDGRRRGRRERARDLSRRALGELVAPAPRRRVREAEQPPRRDLGGALGDGAPSSLDFGGPTDPRAGRPRATLGSRAEIDPREESRQRLARPQRPARTGSASRPGHAEVRRRLGRRAREATAHLADGDVDDGLELQLGIVDDAPARRVAPAISR